MKLGLKIILPILLLLVTVIGAYGYVLYSLGQQETVISTEAFKIRTLNGLNERLVRQQERTDYNVLAYRFQPDRSFLLAISQAELDKSKTLDEMYPFITSSRGLELIDNYINSRKTVESLRNELIQAIDEGNQDQVNLSYNKWSIQTQDIKAALADIGAYNINSLEKTLASVQEIKNKIVQIIIILAVVVAVTVLCFYYYLTIVITAPIIKLAQFAEEVANKNFTTTTTTTTTTSKDELGMLSRAFNTMVFKLKESYTTLEQKVAARTADLTKKNSEIENTNKAVLNILADLKINEQKLTIEKVKDDAILASIGEGMIVVDNKQTVTVFNKSAQIMTDRVHTDLLGKKFDRFAIENEAGQSVPFKNRPLIVALTTGKSVNANYYLVRKDKTRFPVAFSASPIIQNNNIIGAVVILRDITKEQEIDRAKSEFVALASHQLRTPLGIIKWYLEALESEEYLNQAPPVVKKYLQEINRSNERELNLVRDLLSVSRIDQGRVNNVPSLVDVPQLIKEVAQQMQIVARRKDVTIRLTLPDRRIPKLEIDGSRFHEVIENLIANAIEYTLAKGSVAVVVSKLSDGLMVIIKDTGIGISPTDQEKIFTKFFRSENAVKENPNGSGLGLYLVKSYVESWGGKISVESVMGKGSTFSVFLPIAKQKRLTKRVLE